MSTPLREQIHLWQAPALGDVEMLHARYVQQRFAPHVHEGYVFTVIESGAQCFWHRGSDHLAPVGSVVLINPDELHTGAKAHEAGWRYRAFYPEHERVTGVLDELELGRHGLPHFRQSVVQDPTLAAAFSRVHRLSEAGASALEQQTAWRDAVLALVQRHGHCSEPAAPVTSRWPWHGPANCWKANWPIRLRWRLWPRRSTCHLSTLPGCFARPPDCRPMPGSSSVGWPAPEFLRRGLPASEVAFALGFADQSHLSRQFKQAFGVTPGAYRLACLHH